MTAARKPKPKPAFRYDEEARNARARQHIAETESEEGCAAEVEIGVQARVGAGKIDGGARAVLHQAERQNQSDGPNANQKEQRDRAIKSKKALASFARRNQPRVELPTRPGEPVIDAGKAEFAGDAPGQNDGLKRVPQNHQEHNDTGNEDTGNGRIMRSIVPGIGAAVSLSGF